MNEFINEFINVGPAQSNFRFPAITHAPLTTG